MDLANEFTNLIQARLAYGLNAQTFKTGVEMMRTLVDVMT